MRSFNRGDADIATTPILTLSTSPAPTSQLGSSVADQSVELCLLETQRQVIRLEEVVHRLTSVAGKGGEPPTGVVSLLQEGNRRLQREVDEFMRDAHAVLSLVPPAAVPISMFVAR